MPSAPTIPDTTAAENSLYIGAVVEFILYGIELILYFKTLKVFLVRRKHPRNLDTFYAAFSTVLLILTTLWLSADVTCGREVWLLHRRYPAGRPSAYESAHMPTVIRDFATAAVFILQQMTDGLMVHRCRIIWDSCRAIIIPSVLLSATLLLGIVHVWATRIPGDPFFGLNFTAKVALANYTVSVFLHATLTCMICYRLLRYARTTKEHLGDQHASPYFATIALFVESVLPYTISGIAFLVSYGVGSPTAIAFSRVYVLMMCVSPQVLILRVATEKAWQGESVKPQLSTMTFSTNCGTRASEVGCRALGSQGERTGITITCPASPCSADSTNLSAQSNERRE